jgi:hypothetical protein
MSDGPFVHCFAYFSQRHISPRKSSGPLQSAPWIAWHLFSLSKYQFPFSYQSRQYIRVTSAHITALFPGVQRAETFTRGSRNRNPNPDWSVLYTVSGPAASGKKYTEIFGNAWLTHVLHVYSPYSPHRNVRHSGIQRPYRHKHDTARSCHRTLWTKKKVRVINTANFNIHLLHWIIHNSGAINPL